jgi:hypothetical protein
MFYLSLWQTVSYLSIVLTAREIKLVRITSWSFECDLYKSKLWFNFLSINYVFYALHLIITCTFVFVHRSMIYEHVYVYMSDVETTCFWFPRLQEAKSRSGCANWSYLNTLLSARLQLRKRNVWTWQQIEPKRNIVRMRQEKRQPIHYLEWEDRKIFVTRTTSDLLKGTQFIIENEMTKI